MNNKSLDVLIFCGINNIKGLLNTINSIQKCNTNDINILIKLPSTESQNDFLKLKNNKFKKLPIEIIFEEDISPAYAINQLLDKVKSRYFQIIPAGDTVGPAFYNILCSKLSEDIDIICTANILMNSPNSGVYQIAKNFIDFLKIGKITTHLSSIIINKNILNNYRFNYKYNYADDIDFLLKITQDVNNFKFIEEIYTIAEIPGRSNNEIKAAYELFQIYSEKGMKYLALKIALIKIIKSLIRPLIPNLKKFMYE